MGGHKTVILEFPLPEAITAVLYKLFGPDLVWARLVTLLFFLGAVRYWYLIIRLLTGAELARIATVIYLFLPLGLFYSRAIHIDFCAVFFAHMMLYHYLVGIRDMSSRQLFLGSFAAGFGFLVKAPYVFYLALPLLLWITHHGRWAYVLRRVWVFLFPIGVFYLWQRHVQAVNAAAPDWDFIPHYRKFDNNWKWYFGLWEQRKVWDLWLRIRGRWEYEVVGYYGYYPFILGFFLRWRSLGHNFMRLWAVGCFAYVTIFFTLNVIHDYYQIPLLAPAAFFLAVPIALVARKIREWPALRPGWLLRVLPVLVIVLPLAFLGYHSVRMTEGDLRTPAEEYYFKQFYTVSKIPIEAGKLIEAETEPDDLVVVSFGSLDCRSPHLLYRARRNGWSIDKKYMTPDLLERLRAEGAGYLALVRKKPLPKPLQKYLGQFEEKRMKIADTGWKLRFFKMKN